MALVLFLALLTSGCNVYEGFYEEGGIDDPEALLEDARLAMQRNEPQQAVTYLRKALENSDEGEVIHTRAQIKLISALLATEKINVLMLRRVAENFDVAGSRNTVSASKSSATLSCKFPGTQAREEFDPVADIDYTRLEADPAVAVIEESEALINRVVGLQEDEVETSFPCTDASAVDDRIAELKGMGLTDEEIAEALVNFAVVQSTILLKKFLKVGGADVRFFYVTPNAGPNDYVSICLPDESTCQAGTTKIKKQIGKIQCSALVLDRRAKLLGSSTAQELADLVAFWRGALEGGVDEPCRDVSGF